MTTHQDLVAEQEQQEEGEDAEDKPEVWYHEGTGSLKRARFFIAGEWAEVCDYYLTADRFILLGMVFSYLVRINFCW